MTTSMQTITPREFIAKWDGKDFGERQASQEMFLDICGLIGHSTPVQFGDREVFTFEKAVPGGSADAFLEERFVWEFKGKDRQLNDAVTQAVGYARHLKNPPLIVVSSFETIRIETNFQGMELVRHDIALAELVQQEKLDLLSNVFHNPDALRPTRSIDAVTQETAKLFTEIVGYMEGQSSDPEALALHLNRIIFCLYAEDAGLLPEGLFANILYSNRERPDLSNKAIANLFEQMSQGGLFGTQEIAHFNGDLFKGDSSIELNSNALQRLGEAVRANWRSIEPSVFGTLFERALDASKRSQTGAHYTSASDIELVVEPVVMAPLKREWETARQKINDLLDDEELEEARGHLEQFRERLAAVTVLDPACGSGNFLYIALRSLLDLERDVIDFAAIKGWEGLVPKIQPSQMLGLEINHYAAELARTALWIGYIQWHQANGFAYTHSPILTSLDTIQQMDAILDVSEPHNPIEPGWPAAEFIVGNPPFLGNKMMRKNLGDETVDAIYAAYSGRLPKGADLCSYWFEKARAEVSACRTERVGLLGTQGIRGGRNRLVLDRIKESGNIFMAVPDRIWALNGAMVHISIVGFDGGKETERLFDGEVVQSEIHSNLTLGPDLTKAVKLQENGGISFQGFNRVGSFDVPGPDAQVMLNANNPHGKPNSDVLKPYRNAKDFLDVPRGVYTVDFGPDMTMEDAALYEKPFEWLLAYVKPEREKSNYEKAKEFWWRYQLPSADLRKALSGLDKYLATGRVSKHRIFSWLDAAIMPDNALVIFACEDDYTFGVLQSRFHELWARASGTQLREAESGFRYTPSTCFEKFPFPTPTSAEREAVESAARALDGRRQNDSRTLTNLYNEMPTWLKLAHEKLDTSVAAAYGWPADLLDEEILERLLTLNLMRGAAQ